MLMRVEKNVCALYYKVDFTWLTAFSPITLENGTSF